MIEKTIYCDKCKNLIPENCIFATLDCEKDPIHLCDKCSCILLSMLTDMYYPNLSDIYAKDFINYRLEEFFYSLFKTDLEGTNLQYPKLQDAILEKDNLQKNE